MLFVVVGPPAAGKSTWVRDNSRPGDITIDYDAIACTLTPQDDGPHRHDHPDHVKAVTKAARQAAIDTALTLVGEHDVFLIHSTPSPALLTKYRSYGAEVITIDPGQDTVMERARAERPWQLQGAIKRWYEEHPSTGSSPAQHVPGLDAQGRPRGRHYQELKATFRKECEERGDVCWLDQRPIDYSLKAPHPDSFSVDHAVPVSEAPELALDPRNFRPSHLNCNIRRGDAEPNIAIGQPSETW
ncbi:hypothetical protein [Mycobacteroides abscessus]|uniref:hypothetical protein n=1 Tax=Mycobacteroides abscessus TaxID=36809 RepID=UPI0009CE1EF9|nr:hypothetical protein [Mycobacteroides abscessus]SKW03344.1 Uncharacterised protein [Mycobacteroides abscessus subsp. abscessus]